MLSGYRTYIIGFLYIVATVAQSLGYIDQATADLIKGILGGGAAITLRMAMK